MLAHCQEHSPHAAREKAQQLHGKSDLLQKPDGDYLQQKLGAPTGKVLVGCDLEGVPLKAGACRPLAWTIRAAEAGM